MAGVIDFAKRHVFDMAQKASKLNKHGPRASLITLLRQLRGCSPIELREVMEVLCVLVAEQKSYRPKKGDIISFVSDSVVKVGTVIVKHAPHKTTTTVLLEDNTTLRVPFDHILGRTGETSACLRKFQKVV